MIKYYDQKQVKEERVYFVLCLQRDGIHSGREDITTIKESMMTGAGNRSHSYSLRGSKERTGRAVGLHTPKAHPNHVLPSCTCSVCIEGNQHSTWHVDTATDDSRNQLPA